MDHAEKRTLTQEWERRKQAARKAKGFCDYVRVLPRDLFNEAKLLKCIGRLCLLILDNNNPGNITHTEMQQGEQFQVELLEEGALLIANIAFRVNGVTMIFKTKYNSKQNYPLYVEHQLTDYLVFNEAGEWDQEFLTLCKTVSHED